MNKRDEIFAQSARKLRTDFDALFVIPHNAVRGGEAEKIIKTFLRAHIPKRFAVGSGFILDRAGEISRQTDVIIYDALNCATYHESDEAGIYPSNNVAAVVEVKSTLDKKELEDAWDKMAAIKKLEKLKRHKDDAEGAKSSTSGFLFAFNSNLSLDTIAKHYTDMLRERGIGSNIDGIAILDKGLISVAVKQGKPAAWYPANLTGFQEKHAPEGFHIATSTYELGINTLDGFFRLLLPDLILFRHIVEHPGFAFLNYPIDQKTLRLKYVRSCTREQIPKLKAQKLQKYEDEMAKEMATPIIPIYMNSDHQ